MLLQMVKLRIDWTDEIEANLIDGVRMRPHLWDPNCKLIKLKQNLYEEIAQEMRMKFRLHRSLFTRQNLIKKFKNLRTYYKKEVKMKSAKPGYQTTWQHFQRLSFLSDPANFVPNFNTNDLPNSQPEDPNPEENQLVEWNGVRPLAISDLDDDPNPEENQLVEWNGVRPLAISDLDDDMEVENFCSSETEEFEEHNQLVSYNSRRVSKRKAENLQYEEAETSLENLTSVRRKEENSFGVYIAARISRIKNRTKRNNLIIEILNLIKSYEEEEDNSDE